MVLGSEGALGREFRELLGRRDEVCLARSRAQLDVSDADLLSAELRRERPDFVVNCAAWTDVDAAEANVAASRAVNAEAPAAMARFCDQVGARLLHFSTDFVFDGEKRSPYAESDEPAPLSEYGRGKLLGERAVLGAEGRYLVVRSAWLYGRTGRSFVEKIAGLAAARDELRAVTDQVGSPTFARDLAEGALALVSAGESGLFHFVNAGQASRYELVHEVVRLTGANCRLSEAGTDEFPAPAVRPAYSVLSTKRFTAATGLVPRHWREALGERYSP
jgi:dTDP-4-dehydrorhamnose reductase